MRARARVLSLRILLALAILIYGGSYVSLRAHTDISNYCSVIRTQDLGHHAVRMRCNMWPSLDNATCAKLASLNGGLGHPLPVHYRCAFVNRSLSAVEAALQPEEYDARHQGECKKSTCRLYEHARSIALEFGMLLVRRADSNARRSHASRKPFL